jgi:outer membrane protein assembly factor BamE
MSLPTVFLPLPVRSTVLWGAVLIASVLSSGCSSLNNATETLSNLGGIITPHKIDIIQGNVVTKEQAAAVAVGMPKAQVRDVLGSPLLTSVFHADRWDYVFTFRRQGGEVLQRRLTAFFKGDVLERIESDELPTETEFVASMDVRKRSGKAPVLQASEETLKAFAERNAQPARPPEPVPPITNYPPLESAQ